MIFGEVLEDFLIPVSQDPGVTVRVVGMTGRGYDTTPVSLQGFKGFEVPVDGRWRNSTSDKGHALVLQG